MKRKQPSALAREKANPYSRYWRNKADEVFMAQYRGQPCEICRYARRHNVKNTVGHHLIPKGRCARHRFTAENMLVLCPTHHTLGREIAAHSVSALVVQRFLEWMQRYMPERYAWMQAHEWDGANGMKIDFREVWEKCSRGQEPCKG